MRIVCQKCSAAYAIDDKFVTAKGVRAQCPRCRHLQLVKKDDPAASAAPDPKLQPSSFEFDAPAPPAAPASNLHFGSTAPPAGASVPAGGFAFDFGAPPPPAGAAAAPPSAGFDFSALPPPPPPAAAAGGFDFGGLQPRVEPPPPPPGPSAADMLEFSDAPPAPERAAVPGAPQAELGSPFDFGGPEGGEIEVKGVKCKSCGKVMTDAFDQALGTCDECRNKVDSTPSFDAPPTRGDAEPVRRAAVGAASAAAAASAMDDLLPMPPSPSGPNGPPPFAPAAPAPAPMPAPRASAPKAPAASAMRADAPSGKGKLIAAAVGVVVVLAVAGYLVVRKPWGKRAPPIVVKGPEGDKNKTVDAIINQWRLNYPEVEGQSSKQSRAWVDSGEELLLKDTTSAYLDAEEEFQKAIVVDPSNGRAVAGWVLAIAFGRGGQIDDQTARSAEAMLQAAEASRSCDPRVYVAHAHLMIARGGNPNDIKVLADRGRSSSNAGDKALAALADGQTLLTKNPQQADTRFKEALQLDPKLKRGYFFQAKLAISQGRYKEAADVLERRLELDKDQWEAAEELARLYVEVGETARARKVLEAAKAAAPTAGRPRLSLAILAYQHLNEASLATEQLLALTQDKEVPSTERAQAWVHLAAIYRAGGETQKAADALEHALESTPDSVPAHLQNFLVLLDRGVTSSARLELDGLKGKLNDPQLEAALEGRLEIAENRLDDAVKTLSAVYEADHRRVDALLLAGAASARARKDGKAWEFCLKKGLRVDPLVRPVPAMTALYVRPADLLRPAVGAFEALSPKSDEDPNPSLCEGLVAWFSEDYGSADKALSRVNVIDPRNAEAYGYRAFIAMHRKDLGGAAKLAGRGLDSSKSTADVYLALAMLQMQSGKPDAAKASAANAQKYNPALYSAKTLQAEASSKLKDNDGAREGLTKVLLYDPLYSDAKRVLFKQGL